MNKYIIVSHRKYKEEKDYLNMQCGKLINHSSMSTNTLDHIQDTASD